MKKVTQLVSVVGMILCFALSAAATDKVGAFAVKDAEGKPFTQDQLKGEGKKSVAVFVQAACQQCRAEAEALKEYEDAIKDKKAELLVVIVDVNSERALKFFQDAATPGKLILDPEFKMAAAMGVDATPSTVVSDGTLKVIFTKTGYRPGDIDKVVDTL